ncbi:NTP pyrophosphohydrolase [Gemmatimonadetes bacterium T265]|nr:NTP pyrophosphohydrolase [Gemmatimonadetes bacterium T265]
MTGRAQVSAGLILFRRTAGQLVLFLAHPGGPFWRGRDAGAWTIPKGVVHPGEELLDAACREFREETGVEARPPYLPLGHVRQRAGKRVHAWAWEGDADPDAATSNTTRAEWPRGSGRWLTYPEVDRYGWFAPDAAREKLNPAQAAFVARLEHALDGSAPDGRAFDGGPGRDLPNSTPGPSFPGS